MKRLLFLLATTVPLFCSKFASAHGLEALSKGTTGLTLTTGPSYSEVDHFTWGADFEASWGLLNGGIALPDFSSGDPRYFAGIGLGQTLQVQGGFGSGSNSVRIRTVTHLLAPLNFEGFTDPKSVFPALALAAEFGGTKGTTLSINIGLGW